VAAVLLTFIFPQDLHVENCGVFQEHSSPGGGRAMKIMEENYISLKGF
jgi:hypothetical protein